MNLTFTPLENKILLEIAVKPRAIRYLYREFVDKKHCSKAGLYKTLASLERKGVTIMNQEFGIVRIDGRWVRSGYDFFRKLLPAYMAASQK